MQIYGKCPVCSGSLYQDYDDKYKDYYKETLKCLMCAREFLKTNLSNEK